MRARRELHATEPSTGYWSDKNPGHKQCVHRHGLQMKQAGVDHWFYQHEALGAESIDENPENQKEQPS